MHVSDVASAPQIMLVRSVNKKMNYLYTIETTFEISGRGCVIVSTFAFEEEEIPEIELNDEIIIETDNGSIDTYVKGIELVNFRSIPKRYPLALLLPKSIKKEDVPIGSKVFKKGTKRQNN